MLRYRLLGKSGLRVSEVCLGTMSFGEQWGFGADEAESHRVLDAYAEAGGNFLDTANKYHGGQTEEIVGRWLQGRRDRQVVATKYTLAMDHGDVNSAGNHRKNLMRSVEASLRRLGTDYIDLLWVHAYDDPSTRTISLPITSAASCFDCSGGARPPTTPFGPPWP
jgi:aryl-alcohol dehydrogenase-like predicted oxidoreductase